jgi:hypothetical protein
VGRLIIKVGKLLIYYSLIAFLMIPTADDIKFQILRARALK